MLEIIVLATMERMVVTGLEIGMQMAPGIWSYLQMG